MVAGVVIDSITKRPIPRALVGIERGGHELTTITDDSGQFSFAGVARGDYSISATKVGYLGADRLVGSRRGIRVVSGLDIGNVRLTLTKESVISGTVRDSSGRPAHDVQIVVFRHVISPETGDVDLAEIPGQVSSVTDERGVYRVGNLAAGKYVVAARWDPNGGGTQAQMLSDIELKRIQDYAAARGSPPGGQAARVSHAPDKTVFAFAPIYHPSALAVSDAAIVVVPAAQETVGIDIGLRLAPTAKLEGTVVGPDGNVMPRAGVLLLEIAPSTRGIVLAGSFDSDSEGKFRFPAVRPGSYTLVTARSALQPPAAGDSLQSNSGRGFLEITMDGTDRFVRLPISVGSTVSGRITVEGAQQGKEGLAGLSLTLKDIRKSIPQLHLDPDIRGDGTFSVVGVLPGIYRLGVKTTALQNMWEAKSAILNGRDLLDGILEVRPNEDIADVLITLTDLHSEVAGSIRDADGKPVSDLELVVFATVKEYWLPGSRRTKHVKSDPGGRYIVQDLPPGEYFLVALGEIEPGAWHDPAFLAQLAREKPISITLAAGEKRLLDIQTVGK